jgi:hypothetical protein
VPSSAPALAAIVKGAWQWTQNSALGGFIVWHLPHLVGLGFWDMVRSSPCSRLLRRSDARRVPARGEPNEVGASADRDVWMMFLVSGQTDHADTQLMLP